ncbi:MAG TPA: hypothetical protein VFE63_15170 [Roseiarcus sp.]|nr:hypothetical protein [Roseiarcus sp.]
MTVTIELKPEIEAGLAAVAAAHGLALPQYVQKVLEGQVTPVGSGLSPAERAALWRASTAGLPISPLLTDEAISRASIYDVRDFNAADFFGSPISRSCVPRDPQRPSVILALRVGS